MSDLINDSQNKRKGLGRGLGSLLSPTNIAEQKPQPREIPREPQKLAPVKEDIGTSENKVWQIAIEKLKAGSTQPREQFNKAPLEELSQSIKVHGILQPIVARRGSTGQFEIIAGERRWRAAQLAGLQEVPVIIRNLDDRASLELAIIENIQREDLNAIEEAKAYQKLALEFSLSHQQIAEKVGKDRATITNSLRVLSLPQKVQNLISSGSLSLGHAKVLLGLQNLDQILKVAEEVANHPMSVRQLESKIKALNKGEEVPESKSKGDEIRINLVKGLQEDLQRALARKVEIKYQNGKGSISINFYSDDELSEITENIKKGWITKR
ncbi:MAG: ParB/RepB/Spo0J family partition protein [Bdellovibrionota bacterium]